MTLLREIEQGKDMKQVLGGTKFEPITHMREGKQVIWMGRAQWLSRYSRLRGGLWRGMALGRGIVPRHVMALGRGTVSRHALGRVTVSRKALGRGTFLRHVMALGQGTVSRHALGPVTVFRHALGRGTLPRHVMALG